MEIHEFDPVIYPYKVWIVIAKTPVGIAERFRQYDNKEIQNIVEDTAGLNAFAMPVVAKDNSSYGVVVFFRSKASMSYGLVAHESSHAAKYLFEHINAEIKEHEPFEYVIGWIAECCEKVKRL